MEEATGEGGHFPPTGRTCPCLVQFTKTLANLPNPTQSSQCSHILENLDGSRNWSDAADQRRESAWGDQFAAGAKTTVALQRRAANQRVAPHTKQVDGSNLIKAGNAFEDLKWTAASDSAWDFFITFELIK